MDPRMQSVMESIWDFAPPPVIVKEDLEDPEEREPPPVPCSSRLLWPSALPSQRWIVAAIAIVFLCWMWYTDRKEVPAATTPASAPAPATTAVPVP